VHSLGVVITGAVKESTVPCLLQHEREFICHKIEEKKTYKMIVIITILAGYHYQIR